MATVDDTVRSAILRFPSLFPSRTAVLHHVLCVIGNGYEWVDGQCVYYRPEELDKPWTAEAERERNQNNFGDMAQDEEQSEFFRRLEEKLAADRELRIVEYTQIVAEVDERMHRREDLPVLFPSEDEKRVYPQSGYSLLMNVPENITPDWDQAVAEMRDYASEQGWVFED